MAIPTITIFLTISIMFWLVEPRSDSNRVFSPCSDSRVQRSDGFTFGIAFAGSNSFFPDNNSSRVQLSPCDKRLSLSNSKLAVFRPKVDQISLLTINTTNFFPDSYGGHMVAFAGRKYAARSVPAFVANEQCDFVNRFLNSRRVGCKIYIGREMDAQNAQATLTLYASTIRTVPLKLIAVRTEARVL